MCRTMILWAASVGLLGVLPGAMVVQAEERLLKPLNGRIIVDYSKLKPAFPGTSGIFRNEKEPPAKQFIAEKMVTQKLPGEAKVGFLQLSYVVRGHGTYNGYWWQYKKGKWQDWSRFKDGKIVLRLARGIKCTARFKFEIKTSEKPNGPVTVFPVYLWLADRETQKAMKEKGYADVAIPIKDFRIKQTTLDRTTLKLVTKTVMPNLKHVTEFTVVFEQSEIPADNRTGILLINSIRLVPAEEMLDKLGRRVFAYFVDHRHPQTGLVRDRAGNFPEQGTKNSRMASIAATGYYLSVLPEAVRRKWMTRQEAQKEAGRIIQTAEKLETHHGLYYHFVDWGTGKRCGKSEVSTLDSAIFLNGAIVAGVNFPALAPITNRLIERVQWQKFLTKKDGKSLLALGWSPEKGLLGPIDVRTSESAMALLLAIGSPKHNNTIDPQCWYNTSAKSRQVGRSPVLHGNLPLFVHYYGLGWADLKGLRDKEGLDLHQNAVRASLANREFCRTTAKRWPTYDLRGGGWWGISAGDSPDGYIAAAPIAGGKAKGTVWPMAALASVPWVPREIEEDLTRWQASPAWRQVLGKYGLAPFRTKPLWIGKDVIGIDLGSFLVNLANYRNRTVWDLWMRHAVPQAAIRRIGFKKG